MVTPPQFRSPLAPLVHHTYVTSPTFSTPTHPFCVFFSPAPESCTMMIHNQKLHGLTDGPSACLMPKSIKSDIQLVLTLAVLFFLYFFSLLLQDVTNG